MMLGREGAYSLPLSGYVLASLGHGMSACVCRGLWYRLPIVVNMHVHSVRNANNSSGEWKRPT